MMKTKKITTVDQILHTDEIADLLKELYENRHEVDQFICIYADQDGELHYFWNGTNERIIYALEAAKLKILLPEED